jgi:subtilisin family serine protease
MKQFKLYLVALSTLTLMLFSIPTTSSKNIKTSEPSPLTTASPSGQTPRKPKEKFNRVENPFFNRYIVVLNDDVVSPGASLKVRRSQVKAVAENLTQLHGGKLGFIYDTALKGFSIEAPEAAAIALSRNPRVDWVEEEGRLEPTTVQSNPGWDLDRIDQISLPLNAQYVYNATGSGVRAYVIDSGIRASHVEFQGRASIRADLIAEGFYFDSCIPTATNNDCHGHGTHVAATIGGATYGVAKSVTIRSMKVCSELISVSCPVGAILAGLDLTTSDHTADPTIPVVANMSLGGTASPTLDAAVQSSINAGVTYVIAAGNSNVDAQDTSPAHVLDAITVGASDINDSRAFFSGTGASNFGKVVDLFAPGKDVLSAWKDSDTSTITISGTSMATPHTTGAVALYLQNRTAMTNCVANPKQGPSTTSGTAISTCPDRVSQYMKSNTALDKLTNLNSDTANRLLHTGSLPATTNPIDNSPFFFWQQYVDFLNREADNGGLAFYVNIMPGCGSDAECIKATRAALSANFFRSPEFGARGGYVANLFNIVFGQRPKTVAELSDSSKVERPHYAEFVTDWLSLAVPDADLNAKKDQLAADWLLRSEVQAILPSSLSNQLFVQKLGLTAGVPLTNESTWINNLNTGAQPRAQVLRAVAESTQIVDKFVLQNFVTMQYIGHLRREPENCHGSPDPANCGYIFHYNRFPSSGDPAPTENLITRGFIESSEYRRRFGP